MNVPLFNTLARVLESEFGTMRHTIRPEATLGALELRGGRLDDFVCAVEDALRLRIPRERMQGGAPGVDAALTLHALCTLVEEVDGDPAGAASGLNPRRAASAAAAAHCPSR